MDVSKENDIRLLIEQYRDRNSSLKDKKYALTKALDILQDVGSIEGVNVSWRDILDSLCLSTLLKTDRTEIRRNSGKVISFVGFLLFDSAEFEEFLNWLNSLYSKSSKLSENVRAEIAFCVFHILKYVSVDKKTENDIRDSNIEKCLNWITSIFDSISNSMYTYCLKSIILASTSFPVLFDKKFEEIIKLMCHNRSISAISNRNFQQFLDAIQSLGAFFSLKSEFATILSESLFNFEKNVEDTKTVKRQMQLIVVIIKVTNTKEILIKIVEKMSYKMEEFYKDFSIQSELVMILADTFHDLLTIEKDDPEIANIMENNIPKLLDSNIFDNPSCKGRKSLIRLLSKILKTISPLSDVKSKIIKIIFNEENGIFVADKRNIAMMTGHDQIYENVAEIVSSLLAPTSFLHLQMTYIAVQNTMIESINVLRDSRDITTDLVQWHEMKLIVLLSTIQPISNIKSSLIVMGIMPPIFEFLTQYLPVSEEWFCMKHPAVYHMLLHVLTGHLICHDYYIEHSDYVVKFLKSPVGQSKRDYARKQVVALMSILKFDPEKILRKTRSLIASWALCLIETAKTANIGEEAFDSKEWMEFRNVLLTQSMFSINDDSLNMAVSKLAVVGNSNQVFLSKEVIEKIKTMNWKTSSLIWDAGDCKVYIRQSLTEGYQMSMECQQKCAQGSSFDVDEFVQVTNFLLKSIVPNTFAKGAYNWMEEFLEMITSGCFSSKDKKIDLPVGLMEKWRWVLSQTANYCIINKMKTPYGKPMDTFNAFSAEINHLAKEILTSDVNGKVKKNNSKEKSEERYPIQWLRVRLLLEFFDILDKMMNFVINGGSSFCLLEAPSTPRQFFIMNQQSCLEWLHRTYYPAIVVAYFNGDYGMTIRFGWCALQIYQRRQRDERSNNTVYLISCWMCRAMAALSVPKHISGMRQWIQEDFGLNMSLVVLEALEVMAAARYETALVMFQNILTSGDDTRETVKLIIHNSIIDILNRLRMPRILDFYQNILFEEAEVSSEDFKSVELLTKFEKCYNSEKRNTIDWNIKQRLLEVESAFSQTMRKSEITDIRKDIAAIGVLMMGADTSCRLYSEISSSNLVISYLIDKNKNTKNDFTGDFLFADCDNYNLGEKLSICRKVMHWAKHLKTYRGYSADAHTEIIRLARKTENKQLAIWHMDAATKGDNVTAWMRLEIARQCLKLAKADSYNIQIREMNVLFCTLSDVFMTSCQLKKSLGILQNNGEMEDEHLREMRLRDDAMSRACIQLATFFDSNAFNHTILSPELSSTLLWTELSRRSMQLGLGYQGFVGSLLFLASDMYPKLSKAHLKYAQWAYELAQVRNFKETNTLFSYVSFSDDENTEELLWKCLENSTAGQLEKAVRKVVKDSDMIGSLLSSNGTFLKMWDMVKTHRIKYLSIAAQSYFAFILNSAGPHPYSKKEETTVATLRILDMLVSDGDILIDVIENGLASTDVHVWKEILPQLFARLSHPSEYIRNTLVNLISRIGKAVPHAVVFQVVSGTASSQVSDEMEEMEDERKLSDDDRNKVHDCCEQLETELNVSYPNLVRDVRSFVSELEKINLLNEEKWSVVLGTMEHEMEKRLALIRSENAATAASKHLSQSTKEHIISEKTKLMTSQIFDVLDELYTKTCVNEGVTENEKQFQANFRSHLTLAFKESKQNRAHPEKAWAPFKNLISILVHRNMKRGMQSFETNNISPYLSNLKDSCVPIPGQDSVEFDKIVTISAVSKLITILPTKTRPKKLAFVGNDGKMRTFLFKGREDLHLDERVMQFLRLCNVMLNPGKTNRTSSEYQAHNYAVIPLGPRSGLIKWVEGATPLFTIYRKWQHREKALRQTAKKSGETISEIERPTEMYHRMIRQAFSKHKVDAATTSDRSKWPPNILQEVFEELVEKTPKDLISRELWTRSGCATTWWKVTTRYARSYAVMSMIGSVLGLGDRHLDNVLLDLTRGHVVHIDYNICFDKGRKLRIPETVPFRLTQNMVHALGPASVRGEFRESCVHVLSTLRNGKQALTMLLDAFVFDPLVDWTNHEHGTSNGISFALQLAVYGSEWKAKVSQSNAAAMELFKLKICELSVQWMQNKEDLRSSIQAVSDCLKQNGIHEFEAKRVEAGRRLLGSVTQHHSIMKDIRPLIRTILRSNCRFQKYYRFYKRYFSDPLLEGHVSLSDNLNLDIQSCVKKFSIVLDNLDAVFEKLLELSSPPIEDEKTVAKVLPPPGISVWVNEEQVENVMARAIVRNVERRLDGFVSTAKESVTPSDQADALIADAMSVRNLSLMYEGWTAWV